MDRDSQYSSSQKTKRMRTSFKHHQLRTMKSYFAINHNPDAKDLKQLAQKTGLTKRVLQVRLSASLRGDEAPVGFQDTPGCCKIGFEVSRSLVENNGADTLRANRREMSDDFWAIFLICSSSKTTKQEHSSVVRRELRVSICLCTDMQTALVRVLEPKCILLDNAVLHSKD